MAFQFGGVIRRHLQLDEFAPMRGDKMAGRSGQFVNPPDAYVSLFGNVGIFVRQSKLLRLASSPAQARGGPEDGINLNLYGCNTKSGYLNQRAIPLPSSAAHHYLTDCKQESSQVFLENRGWWTACMKRIVTFCHSAASLPPGVLRRVAISPLDSREPGASPESPTTPRYQLMAGLVAVSRLLVFGGTYFLICQLHVRGFLFQVQAHSTGRRSARVRLARGRDRKPARDCPGR